MEETKKCPYCGEEILAVAKKCKHCKRWLNEQSFIDCPICGETIPSNSQTCPKCGESVKPIEQDSNHVQSNTGNLSQTIKALPYAIAVFLISTSALYSWLNWEHYFSGYINAIIIAVTVIILPWMCYETIRGSRTKIESGKIVKISLSSCVLGVVVSFIPTIDFIATVFFAVSFKYALSVYLSTYKQFSLYLIALSFAGITAWAIFGIVRPFSDFITILSEMFF